MPIPPKIAAIYLLGALWKEDCDRFTRVTTEGLLSADEMDAVFRMVHPEFLPKAEDSF